MTLGQKIKKLRTEKGLTQKDLADDIHVTFQTVSKWENDENEPDVSTIRELAKLFGCTLDYLLSEEEEIKTNIKENNEDEKIEENNAPIEATKTIKRGTLPHFMLNNTSFNHSNCQKISYLCIRYGNEQHP